MAKRSNEDLLDMDPAAVLYIVGDLELEIERHHRDFELIRKEVHSALNLTLTPRAHRDVLKRIRKIVG